MTDTTPSADRPVTVLPAAEFDRLQLDDLVALATPDPAPALAAAFNRPRRFSQGGFVHVEFSPDTDR